MATDLKVVRHRLGRVRRPKKVAEFIQFLPVIAYDGFTMNQIDAAGVLEMAMSGSTATLLARRWQAAVLVNRSEEHTS